jgi:hypothetical protein
VGRKKTIQVLNWDKYQARADKELPWCKLWGALFKRPWFQNLPDDEKFVTIVFLDLARQFNNKIPDLSEFKGYLRGNYGVFMDEERVFNLCKVLSDNEFLSDSASDIQDKTRQDKTRQESPASPGPIKKIDESKQVCLKDIEIKDQSEGVKHKIFNQIVDAFKQRGWRTEPEYVKKVFKNIVEEMEGYNPAQFFPYFNRVAMNHINRNGDMYAADSKAKRGQYEKIGVTVGGMMV